MPPFIDHNQFIYYIEIHFCHESVIDVLITDESITSKDRIGNKKLFAVLLYPEDRQLRVSVPTVIFLLFHRVKLLVQFRIFASKERNLTLL